VADRRELLKRIWLFRDLDDGDLLAIAEVARERNCRAGDVLVRQGDRGGDLFTVVQGRLKAASHVGEGDEVFLSVIAAGDVFGELALLDQEPRSATVVAVEPCRLLVVPALAFRALLLRIPGLSLSLLKMLAGVVRRLSTRTEDAASLDVSARLAKTLLTLADRFGVPGEGRSIRITIHLSQEEIGRMIGATREMVNKCLRAWAARRILRHAHGVLTITSTERLRAIVDPTDNSGATSAKRASRRKKLEEKTTSPLR